MNKPPEEIYRYMIEIRESNLSQYKLAETYNISAHSIWCIRNYKTYIKDYDNELRIQNNYY